jgi:hypothetical protein
MNTKDADFVDDSTKIKLFSATTRFSFAYHPFYHRQLELI